MLAAEPPEYLEAIRSYLELRDQERRTEAMRERLRQNLG